MRLLQTTKNQRRPAASHKKALDKWQEADVT